MIPGVDSLPARICNESAGGVKLRVSWKGWLPRAFDLQNSFTGVRGAVQAVWSQFSSMGVRFRESKLRDTRRSDFGQRRQD